MHSPGTLLSGRDPLADIRAGRSLERQSPGGDHERHTWKPIDTAPSDGTTILAWVRWQNASASACIVAFTNKRWRRVANGREIAGEALTYWRPVPSGPMF
jgi:hypothetical protein